MKKINQLLIAAGLVAMSSPALAGVCASGYITDIAEGGWNSNNLNIKLQYTSANPPNSWNGYMRFKDTLNAERLKAIRALAYLALANGNEVTVESHNGTDCANATQLIVHRLPPST